MQMQCVERYTVRGDTVTLDYSIKAKLWTVACITAEGDVHWALDFADEQSARVEFERWRK